MDLNLKSYTTLGRTGLRVSPLCLGAMTFGTQWGWGSDEATARSVFDRYIDAGGNFVDTADGYQGGQSEQLTGRFIQERNLRDQVVLATKFTFNGSQGNPNSGGNGRKNIYRALEASLRRLNTDYIDLYWLHAWDTVTPVEEVVNTLTDLVRAGKIRHYGFSDTPAWYVARAYTLAEKEGKDPVAALQLEYSLVERNIEREHIPAAQELGIGICPWSPLAGGFLTGKYKRQGDTGAGDGRLTKGSPFNMFTERNWQILGVFLEIAREVGKTPAQVALNWVATQPGITSTIIGASTLAQLNENLGSLDFAIPAEARERLEKASGLPLVHPYVFFKGMIQNMIHGGVPVKAWSAASGT
ncbi:MAG TPA: aldo/keto reductase [Bryobacteraceae bacterium]|nr:aldo/keto reductase [Bryobacteraceae bacterium]